MLLLPPSLPQSPLSLFVCWCCHCRCSWHRHCHCSWRRHCCRPCIDIAIVVVRALTSPLLSFAHQCHHRHHCGHCHCSCIDIVHASEVAITIIHVLTPPLSLFASQVLRSCGTWVTYFLSFLTIMYLYDHLTTSHMTAYLYIRATSPGTLLFPPFVRSPLFPSYSSLWPPLFVTPLFCDAYYLWLYCSPLLYA